MPSTLSSHPSSLVLGRPHTADGLRNTAATALRWGHRFWMALTTRVAPKTTQPLTRFQEAEQTRAMADKLLSSDPRFAHELYAAADRHERAAQN